MKTLLFKPFERYSETTLLLVGFGFTLLSALAAFAFNVRYDGVLDMHAVKEVSLQQVLIDTAVNLVSLFTFFYLAAVIVYKRARPVDLLSTVLVARIPMVLLPLLNVNNYSYNVAKELIEATKNIQEGPEQILSFLPFLGLTVVMLLVVTAWYVALLYNGFKVATNAKGAKPVVLFIAAILLAEILSKTLLYFIK